VPSFDLSFAKIGAGASWSVTVTCDPQKLGPTGSLGLVTPDQSPFLATGTHPRRIRKVMTGRTAWRFAATPAPTSTWRCWRNCLAILPREPSSPSGEALTCWVPGASRSRGGRTRGANHARDPHRVVERQEVPAFESNDIDAECGRERPADG
jgi:hypothetical protein